MDTYIYKLLLEASIHGGAEDILKVAYGIFKRPICIFDLQYRLISQYPKSCVSEEVFDMFYQHRHLSSELILRLEQTMGNYRREIERSQNKMFFIDWDTQSIPRVFGPLCYEGKIISYLFILYPDDKPSEEEMYAAQLIADVLSAELWKTQRLYSGSEKMQHFLLGNLIAHRYVDESILLREDTLFPCKQRGYQVLCAQSRPDSPFLDLEHICFSLEAEGDAYCYATIFEDRLYMLFFGLGSTEMEKTPLEGAIRHLVKYNIVCGLSERFYRIKDFPEQCYMAKDILKVSHFFPEISLFPFEEFALCRLISRGVQPDYPHLHLHPGLKQLQIHDAAYGTDYTATLETYLVSFKDLSGAAEKLNIHRNSLKYRLGKIEELTGMDLADVQTCTHLLMNFLSDPRMI
ncbi:MAG: helix-turn-helix domain-containing protein [Clostridia bacterium]|nr:helix-turn-helix domain-containing protein [Clostridia bacterium]MBQ9925524.1 helix-turn-helix domain-containing protein [Clostridia bacterium]